MPAAARIDWEAARLDYLAQAPPRSFGAVARRFGISDVAVGRRAKREHWVDQAAKLDRKAAAKVEAYVVRDRVERTLDSYRVIDQARAKLIARLDADTVDVELSDMPALLKIEQLLDGEATSIVDVRRVQVVFDIVLASTPPILVLPEAERWPAFLAMMERTAEQISIRASSESGES